MAKKYLRVMYGVTSSKQTTAILPVTVDLTNSVTSAFITMRLWFDGYTYLLCCMKKLSFLMPSHVVKSCSM